MTHQCESNVPSYEVASYVSTDTGVCYSPCESGVLSYEVASDESTDTGDQ